MSRHPRKNRHQSNVSRIHYVAGALLLLWLVMIIQPWKWFQDTTSFDQSVPLPEPEVKISEADFLPAEPFSTADDLKKILVAYTADPSLGPAIEKFLQRLPDLRAALAPAGKHELPVTLDVLLQDHGETEEIVQQAANVVRSQELVYQLLKKNQYDVAAMEGSDVDPMTMDSLCEDIIAYGRQHNLPVPTKAQALAMIEQDFSTNGFTRYLAENTTTRMIGMEDRSLNHLHRLVLDQIKEAMVGNPTTIPIHRLDDLNELLSRLRSELSVAKTVLKLQQCQGQRGALVIGWAHKEDTIHIMKKMRIKGAFYNTLSP